VRLPLALLVELPRKSSSSARSAAALNATSQCVSSSRKVAVARFDASTAMTLTRFDWPISRHGSAANYSHRNTSEKADPPSCEVSSNIYCDCSRGADRRTFLSDLRPVGRLVVFVAKRGMPRSPKHFLECHRIGFPAASIGTRRSNIPSHAFRDIRGATI